MNRGDRPPIEARLAGAGLPPLPRLAWLEIDLDRLAGNLAAIRGTLAPGTRVEPVVKADAYGHGLVPIAAALERAGADGFCVATLDEALHLRRSGIGVPILVLYPVPPAAAADAALGGVTVSLGDPVTTDRTIEALEGRASPVTATEGGAAGWAGRPGSTAATGAVPLTVQIEVETGLGRGGFAPDAIAAAVARIEGTTAMRLGGIWTHLANAADPDLSAGQDGRFAAVVGGVDRELRRHVAASAAILGRTVRPYDSVRPGLAVYGLVPDELAARGPLVGAAQVLRPVLSLHARPTRVADLPAGHGVGYGPAFVTDRPSRIATLPLGYGDGWPRSAGGRSSVLVRGRRVPFVGTVAMDGVLVDVTDVPGRPVDLDDEFVLIGSQGDDAIDAFEVARARNTIVYDVVTIMAGRLPRVYHAAGVPTGARTLIEQGDP